MAQSSLPVLYSFRRCPYAMRARMALNSAGVKVEHREILLKNKPPSMLQASAKGTVPVLVLADQDILDESWQIAVWALSGNDPENLLGANKQFLDATAPLVERCDGEFKSALDKYKYSDRQPLSATVYRQQGMPFLNLLESMLQNSRCLLSNQLTVADIALMPFVRQFAHVDKPWFEQCGLPRLAQWLDLFIASERFQAAMQKHPLWEFDRIAG